MDTSRATARDIAAESRTKPAVLCQTSLPGALLCFSSGSRRVASLTTTDWPCVDTTQLPSRPTPALPSPYLGTRPQTPANLQPTRSFDQPCRAQSDATCSTRSAGSIPARKTPSSANPPLHHVPAIQTARSQNPTRDSTAPAFHLRTQTPVTLSRPL